MSYEVEVIYLECDEEPMPEGVSVGDIAESREFDNEQEAKEFAWKVLEEGFGARLWIR
jgi:hypothetical protein